MLLKAVSLKLAFSIIFVCFLTGLFISLAYWYLVIYKKHSFKSKIKQNKRKNRIEVEHANDSERENEMQTFREQKLMIESEINEKINREMSFDKEKAIVSDYSNQTRRNKIGISNINNGKEEISGHLVKKSRTKKSYKKLDLTGIQSKYLHYNKQINPVFKDYLHKSNKPFIGYVSKV